jgi:hypothetical protein
LKCESSVFADDTEKSIPDLTIAWCASVSTRLAVARDRRSSVCGLKITWTNHKKIAETELHPIKNQKTEIRNRYVPIQNRRLSGLHVPLRRH